MSPAFVLSLSYREVAMFSCLTGLLFVITGQVSGAIFVSTSCDGKSRDITIHSSPLYVGNWSAFFVLAAAQNFTIMDWIFPTLGEVGWNNAYACFSSFSSSIASGGRIAPASEAVCSG